MKIRNPLKRKKPKLKPDMVSKSLMKLHNKRRKKKLTVNQIVNEARANMLQYNIHIGTPFYQLYNNFIKKTQGKPTKKNKNVRTLMNQTQNEININRRHIIRSLPTSRRSHKRASG